MITDWTYRTAHIKDKTPPAIRMISTLQRLEVFLDSEMNVDVSQYEQETNAIIDGILTDPQYKRTPQHNGDMRFDWNTTRQMIIRACEEFKSRVLDIWNANDNKKNKFYHSFIALSLRKFKDIVYGFNPLDYVTLYYGRFDGSVFGRIITFEDIVTYVSSDTD
jgi:hypothetical protein